MLVKLLLLKGRRVLTGGAEELRSQPARLKPRGQGAPRREPGLKPWLLCLLGALALQATAGFAGTTFYAAPNGSTTNDGLTASAPWPLVYAIAHTGASNTVILLDGVYTNATPINILVRGLTIKAQHKWGAKFWNNPGTDAVFLWPLGWDASFGTIDGVAFSNCQYYAVLFRDPGLSNCVMRNCWVQHTGQTWPPSHAQSGMQTYAGTSLLVENNLMEWNGTSSPGYNHGIYAAGTNGVYRNNVCRYNGGYGIQISGHGTNSPNNLIYNNLIYANTASPSGQQLGIYDDQATGPVSAWYTNYVFGNTIISYGSYFARFGDGTVMLTNNILISTNIGISRDFPGDHFYGANNIAPQQIGYGVGTIITNFYGFVNSPHGLYWLATNSPARNAALGTVAGTVDFFGVPQSSVTDIGAFQYNAAYSGDSRVLDPSPAYPDYWTNLASAGGGSASINVTPNSQSFGPILAGTVAEQAFILQNNGSASVSGTASVAAPFSILSGGTFNLAPGQSQKTMVGYSPTTAGQTISTLWFIGDASVAATITGLATNAWIPGELSLTASSGTLSPPFIATGGYIYQPSQTTLTNGGQALYSFSITSPANYAIQAVVNAPNDGANSFYINIDAPPQDPTMIWDIPVTAGFEARTVSWRGNGTDSSDQFIPKTFYLSVGTHQIVLVGREGNTQLQQLTLIPTPLAPLNLRTLAGP